MPANFFFQGFKLVIRQPISFIVTSTEPQLIIAAAKSAGHDTETPSFVGALVDAVIRFVISKTTLKAPEDANIK